MAVQQSRVPSAESRALRVVAKACKRATERRRGRGLVGGQLSRWAPEARTNDEVHVEARVGGVGERGGGFSIVLAAG